MEVKFAKLLNEFGVSAEQTTKKIAELKADFDEAYSDYQEAVDNLNDIDDEDEKQDLLQEINDFERDLAEADAELVKRLESWNKNKDVWAKGQAALAEKRAAKKNGGVQNNVQIPTNVATPPLTGNVTNVSTGSTTTFTNEPNVGGIPNNSSFQGDGGVIKKKGNGGWWILAAVVGVLTLGAVAIKRE